MALDLFLSFVLATIVFVAIPGPNVTLIIANSLSFGARFGLATVAGTNVAIALQLIVVVLGTGSLLIILSEWFSWIRWLGVAYLVYLGLRVLRDGQYMQDPKDASPVRPNFVYWQGFLVALTNPKIMIFLAAFFPQFVDPSAPIMAQMMILAITFLFVGALVDSLWALTAGRGSSVLSRYAHVRSRVLATMYLATAAGLAALRRS